MGRWRGWTGCRWRSSSRRRGWRRSAWHNITWAQETSYTDACAPGLSPGEDHNLYDVPLLAACALSRDGNHVAATRGMTPSLSGCDCLSASHLVVPVNRSKAGNGYVTDRGGCATKTRQSSVHCVADAGVPVLLAGQLRQVSAVTIERHALAGGDRYALRRRPRRRSPSMRVNTAR
jgi:hypothetical protein